MTALPIAQHVGEDEVPWVPNLAYPGTWMRLLQADIDAGDFTELIKVRVGDVEVAGTGFGPRNIPYLVGVWGQSFYMPFADHIAIFRYVDQPGMIGRVGGAFGEHGVNIVSAAVGAEASGDEAVMALTTDGPVPDAVIEEIASGEGFYIGRGVDL